MESQKVCAKCKRALSRDSFYKDKNRRDGLDVYCKNCRRQWELANREKRSEYFREYYKMSKNNN